MGAEHSEHNIEGDYMWCYAHHLSVLLTWKWREHLGAVGPPLLHMSHETRWSRRLYYEFRYVDICTLSSVLYWGWWHHCKLCLGVRDGKDRARRYRVHQLGAVSPMAQHAPVGCSARRQWQCNAALALCCYHGTALHGMPSKATLPWHFVIAKSLGIAINGRVHCNGGLIFFLPLHE